MGQPIPCYAFRMRGLRFLTILVIAAATSGCQQYYEGRIDRLYARCGVAQMSPNALEECLDQTQKLAVTYPSPRLDTLLAQLERSAEPPPPPVQVGDNQSNAGSDNSLDAGREGYDGEMEAGDEPFQPDYEMVPPREPEPPSDPD